jgi:hypothetical protein
MALFWLRMAADDFVGLDMRNQHALAILVQSIFTHPGTSRETIKENSSHNHLWTHNRNIAKAVEAVVKSSAAE